ncbi:MAG: hypothetical protein KC457_36765, partial [Myxococcales bacterium]|nr:hypothetical protein [Myxococcales bacterium]
VELSDEQEPMLLRTGGSGWGPTVWFWAWVLAIAAVAVTLYLLARKLQAVKLHDWFLLGLGIPTAALPMVLGWFLLVGQRRRLIEGGDDRRYNTVQLAIGLVTVLTVLVALGTVRMLLTEPMWTMPTNFFGEGELLVWYADRSSDAMPQGTVLSVPSSLWRVLGMAWVAWFGWRGFAWFKWFRAEVGEGGWLR